jgi:hypothetical protein
LSAGNAIAEYVGDSPSLEFVNQSSLTDARLTRNKNYLPLPLKGSSETEGQLG